MNQASDTLWLEVYSSFVMCVLFLFAVQWPTNGNCLIAIFHFSQVATLPCQRKN